MSILYAHIAAGSKSESGSEPVEDSNNSSDSSVNESEHEETPTPEESGSEAKQDDEPEVTTSKKTTKKPQLNLAPAPVPLVNVWGSKSDGSSNAKLEDSANWPSPLTAIQDGGSDTTKKPVAKNSGKEKWVPYQAAAVVIVPASSASKPAKAHSKRSNKKKVLGKVNGGKPGKVAAAKRTSSSGSKTAEAEESKPEDPAETELKSEEKKDPKINGAEKQNFHQSNPNFHYNKGFYSNNARYIRANYNPYKGKAHFGNKHYYSNNARANGQANGAGLNSFKQQSIPYVQGFIPQQSQQAPLPPNFYPPFNGGYYNGDVVLPPQQQQPQFYGEFPNQNFQFNAIISQISYYFSVDNLVKDLYLRKQMNSSGFIPISVIGNFYRMQTLTGGRYELVVEALKSVNNVEVRGDFVRLSQDHEQWVLPLEEREENGLNEQNGQVEALTSHVEALTVSD